MAKIKFNAKDERVVLGLGRCGHFTEDNFKSLGYSASRIKNLSCGEMKLYEKVGRDCNTGENVYKLSDLGKERCADLGLSRDLQYRPQGKIESMNFQHDRELASRYCSLDENCQSRWKTEEMYKREIEEAREHIRIHHPDQWEKIEDVKMTSFDGGYVDERGQEQYVEVITKDYREVASKEASASILSGNLNFYNA